MVGSTLTRMKSKQFAKVWAWRRGCGCCSCLDSTRLSLRLGCHANRGLGWGARGSL